jgi:hypothetical protein
MGRVSSERRPPADSQAARSGGGDGPGGIDRHLARVFQVAFEPETASRPGHLAAVAAELDRAFAGVGPLGSAVAGAAGHGDHRRRLGRVMVHCGRRARGRFGLRRPDSGP